MFLFNILKLKTIPDLVTVLPNSYQTHLIIIVLADILLESMKTNNYTLLLILSQHNYILLVELMD